MYSLLPLCLALFSSFFLFFFLPPTAITDGNFAPPLPASPHTGFPHPSNVIGQGWSKILALHRKVGVDGF